MNQQQQKYKKIKRKLKSKQRLVVGTLSTWKNTSIGISVWFWKDVMKD